MEESVVQLVLGYAPAVLAVLLSMVLVSRRLGTDSVLMLVGSVLMLATSIGWRYLWKSLVEEDGAGYGSHDFETIQLLQLLRTVVSAVAQLLFAIGILLLVRRRLQGIAPDPLNGPHVLNDVRAASALADELDALYRGMVLHFVLMIVSLFASFVAFLSLFSFSRSNDEGEFFLLLGLLAVLVFGVLFTVKWCKLHYRHWRVAIEATGFREHTAGQAVGFLFIPLFNLYWMFRSYATLSELLYKAGSAPVYNGRTPIINTNTARTLCIINIFSIIPYVGTLASLVNLFIWFNVHAQHRRTVTHMLRAAQPPVTTASTNP